jgi:hypothetical protein
MLAGAFKQAGVGGGEQAESSGIKAVFTLAKF